MTYNQFKKNTRKENEVKYFNDVVYIKATNCNVECIVDRYYYDNYLKYYNWYLKDSGYFATTIDSKTTYLHRFIVKLSKNIDGLVVHHKNCNKLDNRKSNLEAMTSEEHIEVHSLIAKYINNLDDYIC